MSSILSTSTCGVGTHTTSLPSCPTEGLYVASGVAAAGAVAAGCAAAAPTAPNNPNARTSTHNSIAAMVRTLNAPHGLGIEVQIVAACGPSKVRPLIRSTRIALHDTASLQRVVDDQFLSLTQCSPTRATGSHRAR